MADTGSLPSVGFLGLGAMGFAMSTHLVKSGFSVTGYDIYQPTLDRFKSTCSSIPNSRASVASSPAEAVKDASIICLMVATHHHVNSALFDPKVGAVHNLPQNCTIMINATVPPTYPSEVRKRLTKEFSRSDVKLVDAPVSGGTPRSINGTLTIMSSSDDPANLDLPDVQTVLSALSTNGKTLYAIPGGLGSGTSAKALNQVMCGIHIVGASEIMGLAAINGLDTKAFYDSIVARGPGGETNPGWSWMYENRGPRMLASEPPMSSATSIINKDVGIIVDEEERLGVKLPLLNEVAKILGQVMIKSASEDDSCIVKHYLGAGGPQADLVVKLAGKGEVDTKEQETTTKAVAMAHAVIHFMSAYETVKFAQALDLMAPEQQKRWFSIISGAAGGSTTFTNSIPKIFAETGDGAIEEGFRQYAKQELSEASASSADLVTKVKSRGYEPKLLETAVRFLDTILTG